MLMRRTLMVLGIGLLGTILIAPANGYAVVPPTAPGYWLVGGDGGVFAFNAPFYGSGTPAASPDPPCGLPPPLTYDYQRQFCTAIVPQRRAPATGCSI